MAFSPIMPTSGLRPGDVIVYPYRWVREYRADQSIDGAKDRPCGVIVAAKAASGQTHILLLAISSQPPRPDQAALPLPQIERRRAGLDVHREAWIYVSEANEDVEGQSYYLTDEPASGAISKVFLERVKATFLARLQQAKRSVVRRT